MKFVYCLTLVLVTFGSSNGMSSLTKTSVKFSLDFFRTAYELDPSQNCVLSPIAIQRSLTMLHHVARAEVYRKMKSRLGLPNNHPLPTGLNNRALKMTTKVFHSQLELNPDLLPELQAEHDIDLQGLNFSRPQRVVRTVNEWVSRVSNGIVDNVFSTRDLADDANLIMINTISLNAPWKTPRPTTLQSFKYINGERLTPMIRITDDYRFAEINDLQILELSFESDTDLSMLIIMSKSHPLANIIKEFNLKTYRLIDKRLSNSSVEWDIPEFLINTGYEAKRVLDALGLSSVFSEDAFEMFANSSSRLTNIYQVLMLYNTVYGATAADGTANTLNVTEIWTTPAPDRYVVDRPFMFLIRKNSSNDIIFIGHYSRIW